MKVTRKSKYRFSEMPRQYTALCAVYLPRPIHDEQEYERARAVAEAFAGFESSMTPDQDDYFELLCSLMETWENENTEVPAVSPLEMLNHLAAEHRMSGADISRVLGGSRQLGSMILRGDRSITAEHARKLGKRFGLPAGVFIE